MSVKQPKYIPMGDTPERAQAKETIWRLAALAYAHPRPEFHAVLVSGQYYEAFNMAWSQVNGRIWPEVPVSADYDEFEAGYISVFLHNRKGKPIASLRAGDHEALLQGLSRAVFMLNIINFYKTFGLKIALDDEGLQDEPDHLASLMEFMSVLCHLEAQALRMGKDPSPYQRAQRDFLCRFLSPYLTRIANLMRQDRAQILDPFLSTLTQDLANWSIAQIGELEVRNGVYVDPDAPKSQAAELDKPVSATQDLWG